MQLDSYLNKIR